MVQRIFSSSWVIAVLLGWTAAIVCASPPKFSLGIFGSEAKVSWRKDLHSASREAAEKNRPILIVFGAEWCGYCTKLEKQTLNTRDISAFIHENYVPVHLDLDKEERIAKILDVTSLPCSVMLSPNAELLGRIEGFKTAEPYKSALREGVNKYQSLIKQANYSEATPLK